MEPDEARKRHLIAVLEGDISRSTGRRYQLALSALDERSLHELQRLLRDLEADKQSALRRARIFPWER